MDADQPAAETSHEAGVAIATPRQGDEAFRHAAKRSRGSEGFNTPLPHIRPLLMLGYFVQEYWRSNLCAGRGRLIVLDQGLSRVPYILTGWD